MGKDFDLDAGGFVKVYTDGSVLNSGTSAAKAGIGVWFGEDSRYNLSEPVFGPADNNIAEIQAVTKAAQVARNAGKTKLRIYTDSRNVIEKNFPEGIHKQKLQEMETALKGLEVQWQHVSGHGSTHGNQKAHALANEGAKRH